MESARIEHVLVYGCPSRAWHWSMVVLALRETADEDEGAPARWLTTVSGLVGDRVPELRWSGALERLREPAMQWALSRSRSDRAAHRGSVAS